MLSIVRHCLTYMQPRSFNRMVVIGNAKALCWWLFGQLEVERRASTRFHVVMAPASNTAKRG